MINNPSVTLTDLPSGWLAQTFERRYGQSGSALTSGRLYLTAIWLPAGITVSNVMFASSSTAASGATHGWAALYNPSLGLLGQSADDTGLTWATFTTKTFALTAPAVTTVAGWHYIGICVAASTPPSLCAARPDAAGTVATISPAMGGASSTGLTGTAPTPPAAISSAFLAYGGVS